MIGSILIVKTSALGDIIHTFPVVEYLRQRFPKVQIDWAVEARFQDVVAAHPEIHRVLTINSSTWRKHPFQRQSWKAVASFRRELQAQTYDLLFDLQGNCKSALVTFLARAKEKVGFGFHSVPEKPNLLVTDAKYEVSKGLNIQHRYLKVVQAHLQDDTPFIPQGVTLCVSNEDAAKLKGIVTGDGPHYLVAFSSKWVNKQLPEETLKAFLSKVAEKKNPLFYFIWGDEEEKRMAERLSAAFPKSCVVERLRIPLLQALMRKMDLVIAVDSGALHLCGTTQTPSFGFFGPSSATVYQPLGEQHFHFQGVCPYGRTFIQRCPILRTCPTGACLRAVDPEKLFEAFGASCKTLRHAKPPF